MNIGVQTFTIRKAQKKSITNAYLPLIKHGIKSFEVARIDFNKKNALEIRSLIDKHGIEVSAIQVKPKYVFGAVNDIVEFCKITNCKRVVISMLPFSCILGSEDKFYSFISTLDKQYEIYEKQGITLAYHHHNWEYVTLSNGRRRMDELIEKTKKIKFVHDTYWSAKSGIDPTRQIKQFGNRLIGIHLRDLTLFKKGLDVPSRDSVIGEGVIDFYSVIKSAWSVGCEYFVIEQKTKNPYSDIKKSYRHLESIAAKE